VTTLPDAIESKRKDTEMTIKRIMAILTASVACLCFGGVVAQASTPMSGTDTFTISFVPVVERTADGNTMIDYTFVDHETGIVDGTRIGSGELDIHADGSFNTQNSGIFTGSIAGRSGTAEATFAGPGTFASASGNYTVTNGTGGLAGVHAEGKVSGSATGPTTFVGTNEFKVIFSAP
jgi:hypothetical protein